MKSTAQRLEVANEIKEKCIKYNLKDDLGTKVLFSMLDKYVNEGTTYINKEIKLVRRYDRPRYYLINLYNDAHIVDTVIIKELAFKD
jgi:hypothetical protein